ncbi:MAG: hypothetical protein IKH27_13505 [Oscillospiraceae bacterium]|nr:hypothetical protein [Oscillospiraceae bacterium]
MKKLGIILLTAAAAVQAAAFSAAAEDGQISVRVTIGKEGTLVLPCETVTVKDYDSDGSYTIDEVLKATHEQFYKGDGTGYEAQNTDWGLSVKTLWGVTNGGSFGYAVNDVMSMSLSDKVKDGDYLSAYSFQDVTGFTDHYAYFDVHELKDAKQGDTVTLKLTEIAYKPDWTTELKPVPNAVITLDGQDTEFKTDENGSVSVKLDKAGEQIISFKADHPLSPAAVRATVAAAEAPAETTAPAAETTAAPETTAEAVTTAADTTAAATTTAAAATTAGATAAPNGNAGTTKAAAASTGDSSAVPALAVTMLAAFGTALAMRRRTEK